MVDSLDALRTLVMIVDTGGFSAAARVLRISTNAASQRISRLEDQVGATLLMRTTRKVVPTDEGLALYDVARKALEQIDTVSARISTDAGGLRGVVRVAVPSAAVERRSIAPLTELLLEHPELRLQLDIRDDPDALPPGTYDLVVVVGDHLPAELVARKVGELRWILVASPAYLQRSGVPRTPADLSGHQCLRTLGPRSEQHWTLVDRIGQEVTVSVTGPLECSNSQTLLAAALAGAGIAMRPQIDVEETPNRALCRVLPGFHVRASPVHLVYAPGRTRLPRVRRVFETLAGALKLQL